MGAIDRLPILDEGALVAIETAEAEDALIADR